MKVECKLKFSKAELSGKGMIEEREETVVDLGEGEAEIRQTPIEHLLFPSPSFQSATFSRSSNVQTFWRFKFSIVFHRENSPNFSNLLFTLFSSR